MEGTSKYSKQAFDHKEFLNTYYSPAVDPIFFEEIVLFPLRLGIKNTHLVKSSGGTLLDLSVGPNILHLLPFCEYFSDIIILELNESCVKEIEKWLKKEETAVDCALGAQFITDPDIISLNLLAKEDILRSKVKYVLKYDLGLDNPTEASVPQKADCLFNGYMLDQVSIDEESFLRNLKVIASNIKIGGVFMSCGKFNAQHFTVSEHKFNIFNYNESFLRRCLKEAGFTIKHIELKTTEIRSEVIQYDQLWFVAAIKETEA